MVVRVAELDHSCFPRTSPGLGLTGQWVSKPEAPSELTGLGMCFSDVAVELPFTLMHPKPKEEPPHREGEWDPWVTGVGLTSFLIIPPPHFFLGLPSARCHPFPISQSFAGLTAHLILT